ncbi:MAG: FG-GAP-like repeat-containing protein, partial [Bacteroidia bacterium]
MKKILVTISLILSINQVNAQTCFYNYTNYSVGTNTNTKAITTGDFNGDGHPDLAVAIVTPSVVSILLGNGTGGFGTAVQYTTNTQPYAICSADFNGDGKADVAVANNGTFQGFSVMLGNGTGGLGSSTSYTAGGANPAGIATADFNGDGKKDIVITNTNSSPGKVSVYIGTGSGTFGAATNYNVGTSPYGVIATDISGDGKADIITANQGSNDVTVLLNLAGSFSSLGSFSVSSGTGAGPVGITSADFNGDGKIDLATANNGTGSASILLASTGTGQFSTGTAYPVGGTGTYGIVSADFDGDGKMDLAVCNYSSNNIFVLTGNGIGGLNTAVIYNVASTPVKIACVDFDGDGKPDLATANENVASDNTSVLLNSLPNAISISGNATICNGASTVLTATGTTSYTWSANAASATTNTVSVNPTSSTIYMVTGANTGCSISATNTITIMVNALPTISIGASLNYICNSNPITLTASGASTYTWTNGISNGVAFTPTAVATYTVNATDINNCINTATINIGLSVPEVPQICLVTTDSATLYNNNIIYWNNTQYTNVDSFLIYRYEVLAGNYVQIGAVKGDFSRFIDTVRNLVVGGTSITTGGNPNYGSYKYTLAVRDSCGNIGAQSPYHQTVFLQDQHNGNFNLNQYVMGSGQTNPVTGYALYKDITGTGNFFNYLTTITGTSGTDPGYASSANYRIDILGFNCVSNQRLVYQGNSTLTTRVKSHSNT